MVQGHEAILPGSEAFVFYRLTLDACCKKIPRDREFAVSCPVGRNGLNSWGSYRLHPLMREPPGGCESADHPKFARTAEGIALPVWFRSAGSEWAEANGKPVTASRPSVRHACRVRASIM
jgi:hypothetical protein